MLNIKDIRSNPENFIQNLKKRNIDDPEKIINNILELDKTYRNFLEQKEKLLNERNTISKESQHLPPCTALTPLYTSDPNASTN